MCVHTSVHVHTKEKKTAKTDDVCIDQHLYRCGVLSGLRSESFQLAHCDHLGH